MRSGCANRVRFCMVKSNRFSMCGTGSSPRNLIFSKPSPTSQPASPTRLILPRSVSGLPAGSATLDPQLRSSTWLDYQYEIGRRDHRVGQNRTDGPHAADVVPMRYMLALLYPVTATLEPFLARNGCRCGGA